MALEHEELRESAILYAVGALDPVSARRFERYLSTASEEEQDTVREMMEVTAALPLVLPPEPVPARLKQMLLTDIENEAARMNESSATPATVEISGARRLLIAATIILTLGCGALLWQNRQLTLENQSLAAQLQSRSAELAATAREWEKLISPATRVIALSGDAAPEASAKLIWDTSSQQWVIYFFDLPALPPDKIYQLWYLTSDQSRVSAGTFQTDASGRGELRISVPSGLVPQLAATAVSLEPRGGSPQPTGPIFLKGAV